MSFKADKNFVTKVAFRGFAPPQLLRQFCLRQKRFCGLSLCYVDAPTGALKRRENIKKKAVWLQMLEASAAF